MRLSVFVSVTDSVSVSTHIRMILEKEPMCKRPHNVYWLALSPGSFYTHEKKACGQG